MKSNVKDLSNVKGTYTKVLQDHLQEIYAGYASMNLDQFKNYVLGFVNQAYDTAARSHFIESISKQRTKDGLVMLVNNAWLRGQGMSTNINDRFAK